MRLKEAEPEFLIIKEEGFSFSGKALSELLQSVLTKGASFRFRAKGFSMSPSIKDGDVITVSPVLISSLGFGKVAAFIHPENQKFLIHRVIGQRLNYYFFKGDNGLQADGLIPQENILGVVTRVERKGRVTFLGLGFERVIIAFLSKIGILPCFLWPMRVIRASFRRLVL